MPRDFHQLDWDADLAADVRQLIRLGIREDLEREYDWTTVSLVTSSATGAANVVARKPGVVAGLPAAALVLSEMDARATWTPAVRDGEQITAGQTLATIAGPARTLLTAERTLLNLLGHCCGIATLTRRFVEAIAGTGAGIYDTRKTLPGYRRLEKYAVRCGGGRNHRTGLYDAILIKDNHLAFGIEATGTEHYSPAAAVQAAQAFVKETLPAERQADFLIEVEVDSLEQLAEVLTVGPDIVLLDNMGPNTLTIAVAMRDAAAPHVQLEASGNVNLETVAAIARTGVERISSGALTHGATWLDIGLDWL